jgi:hypothetical protein
MGTRTESIHTKAFAESTDGRKNRLIPSLFTSLPRPVHTAVKKFTPPGIKDGNGTYRAATFFAPYMQENKIHKPVLP